jgi:hypothetical protein
MIYCVSGREIVGKKTYKRKKKFTLYTRESHKILKAIKLVKNYKAN